MLDKNFIKDIIDIMVSNGADFGEVFIERSTKNSISLLNGTVENALGGVSQGIGLRTTFGEKVIYSYTNILDKDNIKRIAKNMANVEQGNSKIIVKPLVDIEIENRHKILIPPKVLHKSGALVKLRELHKYSKDFSKLITETSQLYMDNIQDVIIANSNGLYAEDRRVYSRVVHTSIASNGNEKQTGMSGPGAFKGFEHLDYIDTYEMAYESSSTAATMLKAGYCQGGKMPVIIDNGFGGVIFHEACGHGLEATAVAKKSSVFTDKLGEKIASSKVTAIDDGTIANAWGSLNIDDEGHKTQKNILIKDGVLNSYLIDSHNGKKMGMESTGSGRRESYKFAPTSRMTNTYIDNGDDSIIDIFASVDYGLYAKKMGGGSVQTSTGEFNFSVREGYMVRDGKIAEPVRGATLIGKGQDVLFDIDMVSNSLSLDTGNCGSISGTIPTTVGQPLIRVSEITVGGR